MVIAIIRDPAGKVCPGGTKGKIVPLWQTAPGSQRIGGNKSTEKHNRKLSFVNIKNASYTQPSNKHQVHQAKFEINARGI